MDISIKSIILFLAIMLTALSAGLFYAWSVSVIPGTKKTIDVTYLETMQSINRAILNPAFFLIFFGSLALMAVSTFQQYHQGMGFWLMLAATLIYLVGTFGVTAFGNVPLNNELDVQVLGELDTRGLQELRQSYETRWNRLHMIRTICAVISLALALGTVFTTNVET